MVPRAHAIISYQAVTIYQEGLPVLEQVTFALEPGEWVFLVGKTGSGKSSLLKTLYGDLPVQSGQATVAGFDLTTLPRNQLPFLRRKLGIIFQDFQLLVDRNVINNLVFVLQATGWKDSPLMRQRIAEVLAQVGLDTVGFKMPYQLSGGEQQRLAIARALLNDPLILVADEPTGNLDPAVAHDILRLFASIHRQGTAVFMATHNYGLIEQQPGRVLKCHNKQLIAVEKA